MHRLFLISCCLLIYEVTSQTYEYPPDYSFSLCPNGDTHDVSFNFIVAGAGSAGSTLAVRLSEESSWNVLLLERGSDHITEDTEIPQNWINNLRTDLDYDYKSEPDAKLYKGLDGDVSTIARGKASGGSSTINAQFFIRGSRRDFDNWSDLGCQGWDYDSVRRYFKKMEDYRSTSNDTFYHGTGGPLTCSPFYNVDPTVQTFHKAFEQLNISYVEDFNSELKTGYGPADSSTRDGRRCSTFKAYVSLASKRQNFFYARNILVRQVIIDQQTKTATGVKVSLPNGRICQINASNEIILSTGSIVSPQILMLSGIGPKAHLESFGIPVLADLPVGENFHDHPAYTGLVIANNAKRPIDEIQKESESINQQIEELTYKEKKATLGTSLLAFLNTLNDTDTHPDLQIIFIRTPFKSLWKTKNGKNMLQNLYGYSNQTCDLFTEQNNKADYVAPLLIVAQCKSRGYIKLRSTDPLHPPKITPNTLGSEEDIMKLLRGVRYIQKLLSTKAATEAGLEMQFIDYQACKKYEADSDNYWRCAFEQIVTGFFHPVGSVKMGSENDPTAVLDPRLKVKNIHNLRVVDGSIMPQVVSVNTNPTIIMIGEKAADIIKQDYGKL